MALAGKTLIILVATSVLGSVGAAVGTGLLLRSKTPPAAAGAGHDDKHKEPEKPTVRTPLTIHSLGELVINLADPENNMRYAKASIAVGYEEKIADEEMKSYDPILRDAIIRIISKKSFEDLHKPQGLDKLKEELMENMDKLIPKYHLCNVFLETFAMQ